VRVGEVGEVGEVSGCLALALARPCPLLPGGAALASELDKKGQRLPHRTFSHTTCTLLRSRRPPALARLS
jgi:hypothetical protein